jgi:hypothetical protein
MLQVRKANVNDIRPDLLPIEIYAVETETVETDGCCSMKETTVAILIYDTATQKATVLNWKMACPDCETFTCGRKWVSGDGRAVEVTTRSDQRNCKGK